MRHARWGFLASIGLLVILAGIGLQHLEAQTPGAAAERSLPAGELIALTSDTAEGRQQVTVIDPKSRVMSVYHIQHETGVISLKSVRNIDADLRMDEFNTDSPLPREIRAILTSR